MRYVVLGAGAVGGTVGGRLAQSGREVVLVARGAHAAAIRAHGLRLAAPDGVYVARLQVVEHPRELRLRPDDVLLLTTKTQDTAALLDGVAAVPVGDAVAGAQLPVFCVQNGVANERIALRRFARVYGAVVMLPADHLEPGQVTAQGAPYSGLLDVGRYPAGSDALAQAVAADLTESRFVSRAVGDVMRWKYKKLLLNLGNAGEALFGTDLDVDDLADVHGLVERAREEAVECFRRAGIDWVTDDEWFARRGRQVEWTPVEGRSRAGGSTWQSVVRGAGVETDYLNGEIVLLGRLHGVATPVNEMLQQQVGALVRAGGRPGDLRPKQLLDALEATADG